MKEESPYKLQIDSQYMENNSSPKKRPQIQGIKGYYESEQVEIESPFRKKKGGLSKLSLQLSDTKKVESGSLTKQMEQILKNFTYYKNTFQSM